MVMWLEAVQHAWHPTGAGTVRIPRVTPPAGAVEFPVDLAAVALSGHDDHPSPPALRSRRCLYGAKPGAKGQLTRRRIHQVQNPASATAIATKITVSDHWKSQKRLAGW
jgi:hypothetical protein